MEQETLKRIGNRKNLKKYAEHYEKEHGQSEFAGMLPCLIVWFRDLFRTAGIDDGQVPMLFGYDEDSEEAEDFWTWGHNSRYANTFSFWVDDDLDYAVNMGLDLIEQYELGDFDPDIEKGMEQEQKKLEQLMKK